MKISQQLVKMLIAKGELLQVHHSEVIGYKFTILSLTFSQVV